MSDTPTIRPAMTPKQWDQVRGKPCRGVVYNWFPTAWYDKGKVWLPDAYMEYDLGDTERLQVAAVCLHGHPQGFTRADVALIRSRFDLSDDQWRTDEESAAASLAARIEALLPSEGA